MANLRRHIVSSQTRPINTVHAQIMYIFALHTVAVTMKNRLEVIDHELSVCIEELGMLCAGVGGVGIVRNYEDILGELRGELQSVVDAVDQPAMRVIVVLMHHIVEATYAEVRKIRLSIDLHWKKILKLVKLFNHSMRMLLPGTLLVDWKLHRVCSAIIKGSHIPDENAFLSIRHAVERNQRMLDFLSGIGKNLSALRNEDANFYNFLGPKGKESMDSVISLLMQ